MKMVVVVSTVDVPIVLFLKLVKMNDNVKVFLQYF